MAQTFNIVAKIQLQGPANLRPVVSSIQQQLGGISARVDVRLSPGSAKGVSSLSGQFTTLNANMKAAQGAAAATARSLKGIAVPGAAISSAASLNAQLKSATASGRALGKSIQGASSAVEKFGERVGLAARYFVAFQLGAVLISKIQNAFVNAAQEALQFQKTMAGLGQIGASARDIANISQQIGDLSRNLGVASKDLAETTIVLKGAGLSADEMRTSLEALAKTSLTPTFKSIQNTTEGLIALRQQFGASAGDFERYLGTINTVARQFAAESEDLVEAVRRAGGAFKAASSDVTTSEQSFQQFLALFTSIRATTRESAQEISTGMRTIFARLQSNQVVDNLEAMGINLRYTGEEAALAGRNIKGQFVGAWEAVRRLRDATKGVPTTDPRFAAIVNQIGGFRQISRVIPLLQQGTLQQKAYAAAQAGTNSLTQDANKVQGVFLVRLTKVREEFNALIRSVGENKAIQTFGTLVLGLTSSFIRLADALQPLIPLLSAFAAIKIGRGIIGALPAVTKGFTALLKRKTGGVVPGHGTGDVVPAMMEPGSYVLNKRSAKILGRHKLDHLDEVDLTGRPIRRKQGGSVPTLLEPGEVFYSPQEVSRIGLGKLASLNANPVLAQKEADRRATVRKWAEEQDRALMADPRYTLAMKMKNKGGMDAMHPERHAEGGVVRGHRGIGRKEIKALAEARRTGKPYRQPDPRDRIDIAVGEGGQEQALDYALVRGSHRPGYLLNVDVPEEAVAPHYRSKSSVTYRDYRTVAELDPSAISTYQRVSQGERQSKGRRVTYGPPNVGRERPLEPLLERYNRFLARPRQTPAPEVPNVQASESVVRGHRGIGRKEIKALAEARRTGQPYQSLDPKDPKIYFAAGEQGRTQASDYAVTRGDRDRGYLLNVAAPEEVVAKQTHPNWDPTEKDYRTVPAMHPSYAQTYHRVTPGERVQVGRDFIQRPHKIGRERPLEPLLERYSRFVARRQQAVVPQAPEAPEAPKVPEVPEVPQVREAKPAKAPRPSLTDLARHIDPKLREVYGIKKGRAREAFARMNERLLGGQLPSIAGGEKEGAHFDVGFAAVSRFAQEHDIDLGNVQVAERGRKAVQSKARRTKELATVPQHPVVEDFRKQIAEVANREDVVKAYQKLHESVIASKNPEASELINKAKMIGQIRIKELPKAKAKGRTRMTSVGNLDRVIATESAANASPAYEDMRTLRPKKTHRVIDKDPVDQLDLVQASEEERKLDEQLALLEQHKAAAAQAEKKPGVAKISKRAVASISPTGEITTRDTPALRPGGMGLGSKLGRPGRTADVPSPTIPQPAAKAPGTRKSAASETAGGAKSYYKPGAFPAFRRIAGILQNPANFQRETIPPDQPIVSPQHAAATPVVKPVVEETATPLPLPQGNVPVPQFYDPSQPVTLERIDALNEALKQAMQRELGPGLPVSPEPARVEATPAKKPVLPRKSKNQPPPTGTPRYASTGKRRRKSLGEAQPVVEEMVTPSLVPPFHDPGHLVTNEASQRPGGDPKEVVKAIDAVGQELRDINKNTRVTAQAATTSGGPPGGGPPGGGPPGVGPPGGGPPEEDDFNRRAQIALERRRAEVSRQKAAEINRQQATEATVRAADIEDFRRASETAATTDTTLLAARGRSAPRKAKPAPVVDEHTARLDIQRKIAEVEAGLAGGHGYTDAAERAAQLALRREQTREPLPIERTAANIEAGLAQRGTRRPGTDERAARLALERQKARELSPFEPYHAMPDVEHARAVAHVYDDNTIPLAQPDARRLPEDYRTATRAGTPELAAVPVRPIPTGEIQIESEKDYHTFSAAVEDTARDRGVPRKTRFRGELGGLEDKPDRTKAENIRLGTHVMQADELEDMGLIGPRRRVSDEDILSLAMGTTRGRTPRAQYTGQVAPSPPRRPPPTVVPSKDEYELADTRETAAVAPHYARPVGSEEEVPVDETSRRRATVARERIGLFGHVTRTHVPAKSAARLRAEEAVRRRRSRPVTPRSIGDFLRGRQTIAGGELGNLPNQQRASILEQAQATLDPGLVEDVRTGRADVTLSRSGNVVGAQRRAERQKGGMGTGLGLGSTRRAVGSRLAGVGQGVGRQVSGLGFAVGASFAPALLEQTFGTVDKPTGDVRSAARAQAVGAGLQTAAVGAQIGLAAGPIGAALGAAVGATYGFVNALSEANNRIKELEFEKSFNAFSAALDDIANDRRKYDPRARGQVAAGLASVNEEARRSVEAQGGGGSFFDRNLRGTFLGNALDFEATGGKSFSTPDEELYRRSAKLQSEKRIELLNPKLPEFHQIGEKIAGSVQLSRAELIAPPDASQADLEARRRGRLARFDEGGGAQIAQTISEVQKIPLAQVRESFDRIIQSSNMLRLQQEAETQAVAQATIQLHQFTQVEQAVNAASTSLHGLQTQADHLSQAFGGSIVASRVGNFSEAAGQVGGLDREAFGRSLDFVSANVGGATGPDFSNVMRQVDATMRDLPAAISSADLNFADPEALKNSLAGLLGAGQGNLGLPAEMQSRISTAVEAMDPERLFKGVTADPRKLVEDLIKDSFGELTQVLQNVAKGLEAEFNKFGTGLAEYGQMLQRQGESLDRASTGRLNAQRASATLRAARTGRDPSDFLSLEDLRRPVVERQQRLAGGDAFNPAGIAGRVTDAYRRRAGVQQQLFQATQGGDTPENRLRIKGLQDEFSAITNEATSLQQALEHLADASDETAAIQEKLNDIEKQRQGQFSFTEKLLTANPQQRREMQRGAQLSDVAVRQGSLAGFNPENIGRIMEHLRSLQDVRLPDYGGRTGGQVAEGFIAGANRAVFGRGATTLERGRDTLLQQQEGVQNTAVQAQEKIAGLQSQMATDFITNLNAQNKQFLDKMDALIKSARLSDAQGAQQRAAVGVKRSEVAVEGVKTVEEIGNLQAPKGAARVDVGKLKEIVANPEFATLRAATAQSRSLQAGEEATRNALFGEFDRKGTVFGENLGTIQSGENQAAAIKRVTEQFPNVRQTVAAQTGLPLGQVEQVVFPNLLKQIGDYFKQDKKDRPDTFNVGRGLIGATQAGFTEAQTAANAQVTAARRTIGVAAFGNEVGTMGPAQQVITNLVDNFDKVNQVLAALPQGLASLGDAIKIFQEKTAARKAADQAVEQAGGNARGGIMFRSRGTDTVPAMLTPGEFVVNAAATRANLSILQEINAARGPAYFADGGEVNLSVLSDAIRGNKRIPDEIKRRMAEAEMARRGRIAHPGLHESVQADRALVEGRRQIALARGRTYADERATKQRAILAEVGGSYADEGNDVGANRVADQLAYGPSVPQRAAGIGGRNRAYFDYFDKAIDSYKGKKTRMGDLGAAARNRQQLQSKIGLLQKTGGSADSVQRGQQLLTKLDSSDIGRRLISTNADLAEFNRPMIGDPRGQRRLGVVNAKGRSGVRSNRAIASQRSRYQRSAAREVAGYRRRHAYFEGGGLVPAMVSPGEFVINAESAQANRHVLNHINASRGPIYRAAGGPIGGGTGAAGGGATVVSLGSYVKSTLDGFVGNFSNVVGSLSDPIDKLKSAADTFGNIGRSLDGFATSASSLADRLGGFNDAASSLAKSLASVNIPPKIEMAINGNYNVVLNGGNMFATMTRAVAEQVKNEILQQLGGQIQKAIADAPPR